MHATDLPRPAITRTRPLDRDDNDAAEVVLAADVGGTHARVGLLRIRPGQMPAVSLQAWQVYECASWPGLAEILEHFLAARCRDRQRIDRCTLAVAGYVRGDVLVAENLRWPIGISGLRDRLRFKRLDIVNDFEALACGTRFLTPAECVPVLDAAGASGPTVVVGPGTGFGCAVLLPNGDGVLVMPSEAGHVALAPGTQREIAVLARLSRDRAYVHVGHVLSGPGLVNLYRALADIDGVIAVHAAPKQISVAAMRGDDPLARETLAMFCELLGSFTGDLAVAFKAAAGVVLAGGILPHIRDFLLASDFRTRFLNKGVMREFLSAIPVRLIEHGQLGVLGAAAMGIGSRRHTPSSDAGNA